MYLLGWSWVGQIYLIGLSIAAPLKQTKLQDAFIQRWRVNHSYRKQSLKVRIVSDPRNAPINFVVREVRCVQVGGGWREEGSVTTIRNHLAPSTIRVIPSVCTHNYR